MELECELARHCHARAAVVSAVRSTPTCAAIRAENPVTSRAIVMAVDEVATEAVEEGMAVTGSVATTADMVGVAATAAAEAITEDRGKYFLFGPTILIPDCAFEGRVIQ